MPVLGGGTPVTILVTVVSGELIIVCVSVSAGTGSPVCSSVTLNGVNLTRVVNVTLPSILTGEASIWYGVASGSGAQNIVVTPSAAATTSIEVVEVAGLASNAQVDSNSNSGSGTSPSITTSDTTTFNCMYVQAMFLLITESGAQSWSSPYTSGGQDLSATVSGDAVNVTEGYRAIPTSGTSYGTVALTGGTVGAWCGCWASFR